MPESQRVLGFDFGLSRTGVALGNTLTQTAHALETLQANHGKPDWERISQIINEWQPTQLVVGMPYTADQQATEWTKRVQRFCRQLEGRYDLPVVTVNERYSSQEANQRLKQTRRAGRKQRILKDEIDRQSAVIILENWLSTRYDA